MLDVEVTVRAHGRGTRCGVRVLLDLAGGEEYVEVLTAPSSNNTSSSSFEQTTLRVLVDASIVEAFFDEGSVPSQTYFYYPTLDTSIGIAAVARATADNDGGDLYCDFIKLDVYPMAPFEFSLRL